MARAEHYTASAQFDAQVAAYTKLIVPKQHPYAFRVSNTHAARYSDLPDYYTVV